MPMCGFNQKMLNGLKEFNEGLFEHGIIERARAKNSTLEKTLNFEISDMKRFLAEANNLTNPKARRIIKGLTIYAQGIYDLMRDNEISEYKEIVRELNSFLFKMDQKYYSELEGKQGDMKKLVSYLNGQSIPQSNKN